MREHTVNQLCWLEHVRSSAMSTAHAQVDEAAPFALTTIYA